MKLTVPIRHSRPAQSGGVLIATLIIGTILGITAASYLMALRAQHTAVIRSQAWNAALAMAEAGVDEALAQLNPGVGAGIVNRSANGWPGPSGGLYGPVARTLSGGSYSVVFTTHTFPTIYSTGYVTVPILGATLKRTIRVATTNTALFTGGLEAKYDVNFGSRGLYIDSFDSSNWALSDHGRYPVNNPSRTSTNGTVASLFGPVNLGNATIKGDLQLGSTATYSANNGSVMGEVTYDFNDDFDTVVLPQVNWDASKLQDNTTITAYDPLDTNIYQYVFTTSGNYKISSVRQGLYVAPKTVVNLYVTDNSKPTIIRLGGVGRDAAQLNFYMAGETFSLSGGNIVDSGLARNFTYYGLPSNLTIKFSGNASFTGTIYAPSANLVLTGGGEDDYDFVGAAYVKSANLNGHFNFHYDESLLRMGPMKSYVAKNWHEFFVQRHTTIPSQD